MRAGSRILGGSLAQLQRRDPQIIHTVIHVTLSAFRYRLHAVWVWEFHRERGVLRNRKAPDDVG